MMRGNGIQAFVLHPWLQALPSGEAAASFRASQSFMLHPMRLLPKAARFQALPSRIMQV
jgi:hypothetical protein